MYEGRLISALSSLVGNKLARDLVSGLVKIRRDCATKNLERAVPGTFVETFVQCLQFISTGRYLEKPSVDNYLEKKVERELSLPEGLRICASRVARSMYTFRNKRNIVHKNPIDTNTHDLSYLHQSATWITAELLRHAKNITMEEAGALVALIQSPVGTLVEEIGNVRLVLTDAPIKDEILILLHSYYPDQVESQVIKQSLSRRNSSSVRNRLRELHKDKLIHGDTESGYCLTQTGYARAVKIAICVEQNFHEQDSGDEKV